MKLPCTKCGKLSLELIERGEWSCECGATFKRKHSKSEINTQIKRILVPLFTLQHHSVDEELWRIEDVLRILED